MPTAYCLFADYASSTGFMKGTFIKPLAAMVEAEPPVIFHL